MSHIAFGQFSENFSDGDFISNPAWSGQNNLGVTDPELLWEIYGEDHTLKSLPQSGGSGTRVSYLSTALPALDLDRNGYTWSFRLKLDFSFNEGSSLPASNNARVYLFTDSQDFLAPMNGYYIQLREERITLHRQTGTSVSTLNLSGEILNLPPESWVAVRVTRTAEGEWEVVVNDISQGTVIDNTHTTASYLGVQIRYSANGRSDGFQFDDFEVEEIPFDTSILLITAIRQTGENGMAVMFNQPLGITAAQRTANYTLDYGVANPTSARINPAESAEVLLEFAYLSNLHYELRINGVTNNLGDGVAINLREPIKITKPIPERAIVINEIMADPSSSLGLAEEEYLELLNTSDHPIELEGFTMDGYGNKLHQHVLFPEQFVIVTKDADLFGVPTVVVNTGALTNSGRRLRLIDELENVIDEVTYSSSWYTPGFSGNGYSMERINPYLECSGAQNWKSSTSSAGGTPGVQNAVFDDSPDLLPPTIVSVEMIDEDQIQLELSEPLTPQLVAAAAYVLPDDRRVETLPMEQRYPVTATLLFSPPFISENHYALTISDLEDCAGNVAPDTTIALYYDVTPPRLQDLVVKTQRRIDLYFNEELRSASAGIAAFRLNDSIAPSSRTIDEERVRLNFTTDFPENQTLKLTIRGIEDLSRNQIAQPIDTLFTYQQDIDTLRVISANTLDVYFERSVDPASATTAANYRLSTGQVPIFVDFAADRPSRVRLVFATAIPDNRTLMLEAENIFDTQGIRFVTPEFSFEYDTRPPVPQSAKVVGPNTLEVLFNEPLEQISAEIPNNYRLSSGVNPKQVILLSSQEKVQLTFREAFTKETPKTLTVQNIRDVYGNIMARSVNLSFVFDTIPPRVASIRLFDPNSVEVTFNEPLDYFSATKAVNYAVGGVQPDSASQLLYDPSIVRLYMKTEIPGHDSIPFCYQFLQDLQGNEVSEQVCESLDGLSLAVTETVFLTDTSLQIRFTRAVKPADPADSVTLALSNLPISSINYNGALVTLYFSSPFKNKYPYWLTLDGLQSTAGADFPRYETELIFNSGLENVQIIEPQILTVHFERPLKAPQLHQFHFDIPVAQLVHPSPNERGIKLFLSQPLERNKNYHLRWRGLQDDLGRIIPDGSVRVVKDREKPHILSVQSLLTDHLIVNFSKPIDPSTALAFNHYRLDTLPYSPTTSSMFSDSSVLLVFPEEFSDGREYKLAINKVRDIAGNVISDTLIAFTYTRPYFAQPGDLIINEIMADPNPPVGMPQAEYVEIYNASAETINLFNVHYWANRSGQLIGNVEIVPNEYLILCDDAHEYLFSPYGKVATLTSFPTLRVTGDSVVISVDGEVIDRVQYARSWYRDSQKNAGGYSLERIGLDNACAAATNWIASMDSLGGTPGKINAATRYFVDSIPPTVVSAKLIDREVIEIVFSEPVDPPSISEESLRFDRELANIVLLEDGQTARLTLAEQLPTGVQYYLVVKEVTDCSGNSMVSATFPMGIGEKPTFNQILITEIMATPAPTVGLPDAQYLEIFNPTDRLLSTEGILLRDNTSAANLPVFNIEPTEYVILCPTSSVSNMREYGRTFGVPNWPSPNKTGDNMWLQLFEETIFSVQYDLSWYKSREKEDGGYSLEMIDVNNPCGQKNNWTASTDPRGGTPGTVNAVTMPNPDHFPPEILQTIAIDPRTIRIRFHEKLFPNHPVGQFTFTPQLSPGYVELENDQKSVLIAFQDELQVNLRYQLQVSGVSDCVGNVMPANTVSYFVLPDIATPGDVVINELLFNPRVGASSFVELINTTDSYFNLKGWQMTNNPESGPWRAVTSEHLIMSPGDIFVFTPNIASVNENYPHGKSENYFTATLPTTPNREGRFVLLRNDEKVLDDFSYQENFHNPLLNDVRGVSLERVNALAPTQDANNWKSAAADAGFATPGLKNSQARAGVESGRLISIEPKVFVPGSINSFTKISYQDDIIGSFATLHVFSANGRKVKTLAQNQLLSANGFFTWDGTNDTGNKVRTGMYVVLIEMYNAVGEVSILKETVVVGATF